MPNDPWQLMACGMLGNLGENLSQEDPKVEQTLTALGVPLLSGGTRVSLKPLLQFQPRPVPEMQGPCPFCPGQEAKNTDYMRYNEEGGEIGPDGEHWAFRIIQNTSTPFIIGPADFHGVAFHCSHDQDPLQDSDRAQACLKIARRVAQGRRMMQWFTHLGFEVGQRFSHFHTHLIDSEVYPTEPTLHPLSLDQYVTGLHGIGVWADGVMSGSLFFTTPSVGELLPTDLGLALYKAIQLLKEKFPPSPPMCVGCYFWDGKPLFGYIHTVLGQMGGSEVLAMLRQGPFVLRAPHREVAAYLRGERGPD